MKTNLVIHPIVDPTQTVDYSSNLTPLNYMCHKCGTSGVKLWREYQTFLSHQSLLCVVCSGKEQKKDINGIDKSGRTKQEYGMTDQLGWRIPAVPVVENDTYWGYTAVPEDGVLWWKRLPAFSLDGRLMKMDDFNNYFPGTPEYVYYHGLRKRKKGKNLSAFLILGNQKVANPKAAFYLAKLLLMDTEDTLFGKSFIRSEINWAEEYDKHLKGSNADTPFSPTSGISKCNCSVCFFRDAPASYNPKRECQIGDRSSQKLFGFTGPAKNVFMPHAVYGKDLGHYCPYWLSPYAE